MTPDEALALLKTIARLMLTLQTTEQQLAEARSQLAEREQGDDIPERE